MTAGIKLGISRCLLGDKVRWNGGHKLDPFITQTLGRFVEFVPVCPEVEVGMGTPRESLRLVGDAAHPRLVTYQTEIDHTESMVRWATARVRVLEKENLSGFIFKSDSPSSGMIRVKVYNDKGMPEKKGVGIFAGIFMKHFPLIPVEDDGRLHDPAIRENFIERIFSYQRWRDLLAGGKSLGRLVDFHTRHKLLILSHSPKHYRAMGRWVAQGKSLESSELYLSYEEMLMEALTLKATLKKNLNVLQHIMGYFKKVLSKDEKQELLEIFNQYRDGFVPLIVPVTLINHYVRKHDQDYLRQQVYLNPHPVELKLRTHV